MSGFRCRGYDSRLFPYSSMLIDLVRIVHTRISIVFYFLEHISHCSCVDLWKYVQSCWKRWLFFYYIYSSKFLRLLQS